MDNIIEVVETNIGNVPLRDYYEMEASSCGYNSYEEMKQAGYYIEKPVTKFINN